MKLDGLPKLGAFLLATVVCFSAAASELGQVMASSTPHEPSVALVAFVGVFGLVGRRWLVARTSAKHATSPKRWSCRRRALPPPPELGRGLEGE